MILIYSDHPTVSWWIKNLNLSQEYSLVEDFEFFKNKAVDFKIVFTKGRTFDYTNPLINDNEKLVDTINFYSNYSDLIFCFDTEIHDFHLDIWQKHNHSKVYWITSGLTNTNNFFQNVIPWMYFFESTAALYKSHLANKLNSLTYNYDKELYFDVLLGRTRNHRTFVYQEIINNKIEDICYLSYMKSDHPIHYKNFWDKFFWESDVEKNVTKQVKGTEQEINYHGNLIPVSRIIPVEIYNRSTYSIIAETNYNNMYSFYTEKTAKPLIAKRAFIMFSGYKMLENLKKLGFKTFDVIIDESYDSIENNEERWKNAFKQVLNLQTLDRKYVIDSLKNVFEHNQNHIMNTNWMKLSLNHISKVIYSKLNIKDNLISLTLDKINE
jgi:hypothetical protein